MMTCQRSIRARVVILLLRYDTLLLVTSCSDCNTDLRRLTILLSDCVLTGTVSLVTCKVRASGALESHSSLLYEQTFWCTIFLSLICAVGDVTQPSAEEKEAEGTSIVIGCTDSLLFFT